MSKPLQADPRRSLARSLIEWVTLASAAQALVCGVSPAAVAMAAATTSDPLAQSAPVNPRAAQSVLLAVTRAGDRLVAVGERGVILTSDDHGRQWQQARVPVSVTLTAVHFATPQRGWAVGHSGVILHSDDGGRHWQKQLDGVGAAQVEVEAAKAAVQASPDDASQRRLRDAQRALEEGADKPWLDVRFWSPQDGLVVGAYGSILRTRDGGKRWQSVRGNLANPKGRHLYSVQRSGEQLYIVGEQGLVFRSHDAGEHFEALSTPYRGTFFGLQAQPGGVLLAYGLRGNVWRSSDDGQNWQALTTGQPITVTAGTLDADGRVVLVDEGGRVLRQHGNGLKALRAPQPFAFTSVVTAADGSLVLTGVRGSTRILPEQLTVSAQP